VTKILLSLVLVMHAMFAPWLSLREQMARDEAAGGRVLHLAHVARDACGCGDSCEECCCGADVSQDNSCSRSGGAGGTGVNGGNCRCSVVAGSPVTSAVQVERKRVVVARRVVEKSRGPVAFAARVVSGVETGSASGRAEHPHASVAWTGKRTT